MGTLLQDIRYAGRQLRQSPGFAATAILILTIGIGASTPIFGFVDAALIKPLPYRDAPRLVMVTESVTKSSASGAGCGVALRVVRESERQR